VRSPFGRGLHHVGQGDYCDHRLPLLPKKRSTCRDYLARSCPNALSQFSIWKVLAILPSLMV
jgi:hypothetical protein